MWIITLTTRGPKASPAPAKKKAPAAKVAVSKSASRKVSSVGSRASVDRHPIASQPKAPSRKQSELMSSGEAIGPAPPLQIVEWSGLIQDRVLASQGKCAGIEVVRDAEDHVIVLKRWEVGPGFEVDKLREAVSVLQRAQHDCVGAPIGLVLSSEGGNQIGVLTRFADGGSLDSSGLSLDPTQKTLVIRDILRGLQALHSLGLVHGNLKPGNVLLDLSLHSAQIVDYSVSLLAGAGLRVLADSASLYAAPEALYGEGVPTSDVFSFGVILYQFLTGMVPKPAVGSLLSAGKVVDLDAVEDVGVRGILEQCFQGDPESRPSVSDLLRSFLEMGWRIFEGVEPEIVRALCAPPPSAKKAAAPPPPKKSAPKVAFKYRIQGKREVKNVLLPSGEKLGIALGHAGLDGAVLDPKGSMIDGETLVGKVVNARVPQAFTLVLG